MAGPMLDLAAVERDLLVTGLAPVGPPAWLRASWEAPRAFFESLAARVDAASAVALRSAPSVRVDPYHDCVTRHLRSQTPALAWVEPIRGLTSLGYQDLATLATRRAAAWHQAGARPGQVVSLVRAMGPELAVALLAGLKLGLVVSLVPPSGTLLVARRLAALAPDFVDTDVMHHPLCRGFAVLPPDVPGAPSHEVERSATYAPGQVAALLFDPSGDPCAPLPLPADALLFCALRDAVVALGLGRGEAVAAPGFPLVEVMPALLLATLLAGGTYLHLDGDEVQSDPAQLSALPLRALGVTVALRERLLEHPTSLASVRSWFRNPMDSLDIQRWQEMVDAASLAEVPALNLAPCAAHGGFVLFSPRLPGLAHASVFPAAGVPHTAQDFLADAASPTGHGRLALRLPGALGVSATSMVLAPHGRGFFYGGSVARGRSGRTCLDVELLATLEGLSVPASLCVCPVAGGAGEHRVDLLLFTGGRPLDEAALLAEASRRIRDSLGAEHEPDRILVVPLAPRRTADGAVDHAWCRDQHLTGGLARRAADPAQQLLTRLQTTALDREGS